MPSGIFARIGMLLGALAAAVAVRGADFSQRFDEVVSKATPAQLYAFLYDMPKGGDLHNHSGGANRSEWVYAVCTDPARNGGETFYTCARFAGTPDEAKPSVHFRTIRSAAYASLGSAKP